MHVVIIGAGAAGCFCAVNLKRRQPSWQVTVIEKNTRPLAKVAVTGGGRCNLTNSFKEVKSIKSVYPRGEKLMKRALKVFSHENTMQWFEEQGVKLVTQDDQCVFPKSQDAMEIVNTLTTMMRQYGVELITSTTVEDIYKNEENKYIVSCSQQTTIQADKVIVAVGGKTTPKGLSFLSNLQLEYVPPVPSLFTFNIADKELHSLMGTVVDNAGAKLTGTNYSSQGPVLITHWGLSGPAILKLSSHGARFLAEKEYNAEVSINWFGNMKEHEVLDMLKKTQKNAMQKQIGNARPMTSEQPPIITQSLWIYIVNKAGLSQQKPWKEVGAKQFNKLASLLTNDIYKITGKGQFKDEFVTCGGVSLANIDINTMECKQHNGLYFAGEVLDVDAITGGFNLQAAWSMGYIIANNL